MSLSPRDFSVLERRVELGESWEQIGAVYGFGPERARQIGLQALRTVKANDEREDLSKAMAAADRYLRGLQAAHEEERASLLAALGEHRERAERAETELRELRERA